MGVNNNNLKLKNLKVGNVILIKSGHNKNTKLDLGERIYTDEQATHRICKGCDTIKKIEVFKYYVSKKLYDSYCDICRKKMGSQYVRKNKEVVIVDNQKQCKRCLKFKDLTEYTRNRNDCKKCKSEMTIKYNLDYKLRLIEKGILVMKCNSCKIEKNIRDDYTSKTRTCKKCFSEKFQKRYYADENLNSK